MKFLCIECDEPMKLLKTLDSEGGSLSIIYSCPKCSKQMAMLTNSMETQMVRSMDVKIGGRDASSEPMGKLRSSLISKKETYNISEKSEAVNSKYQVPSSGSKCPFPGMVSEMENLNSPSNKIFWTDGAKARLEKVPVFVRDMVSKGIEQQAKEKGYSEINESVMDEVKGNLGM